MCLNGETIEWAILDPSRPHNPQTGSRKVALSNFSQKVEDRRKCLKRTFVNTFLKASFVTMMSLISSLSLRNSKTRTISQIVVFVAPSGPNGTPLGTPVLGQSLQPSPGVSSFFDVCFQTVGPCGQLPIYIPLWVNGLIGRCNVPSK